MRQHAWLLTNISALLLAGGATAQRPTGDAGIEAARGGGMVIVCRHGITDSKDENEQTLRYDDPSTQRLLSTEGEKQAQAMAAAIRRLQIPAGEVIASPMQRARKSAELILGHARLDSLWHTRGDNYGGPRRELRTAVLQKPVPTGNRFIFSHVGTITSVIKGVNNLQEGDCIVVRPGTPTFDVVGVIPWRAWLAVAR
jgi:phosphohistidine phosphatase SixA